MAGLAIRLGSAPADGNFRPLAAACIVLLASPSGAVPLGCHQSLGVLTSDEELQRAVPQVHVASDPL